MSTSLLELPDDDRALLGDISGLIDDARTRVAAAVNSELVMLYWSIGKRIREDVLGGERAEYGKAVVRRLAEQLTERFGRGYSSRNLFKMMQLAEWWPDADIVPTLSARLSWSHIIELLQVSDRHSRDFYATFAAHERWSVRALRSRIDDKLYERTIDARGGVGGLESELAALRDTGSAPGLVFREPYVLDFLGLPAQHSEADLERAILDDMWRFIIELGGGFAFMDRQKRITVDGDDYYLDLLFYHVGMHCHVAVELKTRKLQPGDYGQMLLYLRWLAQYERALGDGPPIGIILCAAKGSQQTALLGLDDGEIRAARYITEPLRERLKDRLLESVAALEGEGGDYHAS